MSIWTILKRKELPSKEKFDGSLTGKRISRKKYEHVLKVCKKVEMWTMKYLNGNLC